MFVNEEPATTEAPAGRERRVGCGALPDDISRAVDIISTTHQIPGSSAYMILTQEAQESGSTVREAARLIVMAPDFADQRDIRAELST